jgi:multisubunit Na+/H+ antiporter MnhG subunit
MGKYVSVIGGVIAILLGLIGLIRWWDLFVRALLATVPSILILGGLIAFAAGISEIKDAMKSKTEEKK